MRYIKIDYTKNGYRLPTEAEWEYACRSGTTTEFYWGENLNGDYLWYSSNSNGKCHYVGTKLPNNFGLYDMRGNLFEWCNDWHGFYSSAPQIDPTGPSSQSNISPLKILREVAGLLIHTSAQLIGVITERIINVTILDFGLYFQ